MIEFVPLGFLDDIIRQYHVGHIILATFGAAVLGSLLLSRKLMALNVGLFGVIFLLTPADVMGGGAELKLLGLALLVVGIVLYTTFKD
jgi:hypothetical protein